MKRARGSSRGCVHDGRRAGSFCACAASTSAGSPTTSLVPASRRRLRFLGRPGGVVSRLERPLHVHVRRRSYWPRSDRGLRRSSCCLRPIAMLAALARRSASLASRTGDDVRDSPRHKRCAAIDPVGYRPALVRGSARSVRMVDRQRRRTKRMAMVRRRRSLHRRRLLGNASALADRHLRDRVRRVATQADAGGIHRHR